MFRALANLILIAALLAPLPAQVTTGTILGTVTDASGATVAKASVEVKAVATNQVRSTVTDGEGNYILTSLPVGEYELTVSAAGFRKEVQQGIVLQVQQRARLDVSLQPGSLSETISVVAAAPIVSTEDGVFGDVIDNRRVVDLPLNGRNFNTLALLTPNIQNGVQGGATLQTFLAGGIGIWAHGNRDTDNEWNLDGASMSVGFYNWNSFNPSIDAIQEFKMQTETTRRMSDSRPRANVNIVTKSARTACMARCLIFCVTIRWMPAAFSPPQNPSSGKINSVERSAARSTFPRFTTGRIARSSSRTTRVCASGRKLSGVLSSRPKRRGAGI